MGGMEGDRKAAAAAAAGRPAGGPAAGTRCPSSRRAGAGPGRACWCSGRAVTRQPQGLGHRPTDMRGPPDVLPSSQAAVAASERQGCRPHPAAAARPSLLGRPPPPPRPQVSQRQASPWVRPRRPGNRIGPGFAAVSTRSRRNRRGFMSTGHAHAAGWSRPAVAAAASSLRPCVRGEGLRRRGPRAGQLPLSASAGGSPWTHCDCSPAAPRVTCRGSGSRRLGHWRTAVH